jgi:hypothetical protein
MTTTGLKGTLDDAYTHAQRLKAELGAAFYNEATGKATEKMIGDMYDLADDLSSRLSNLILQLRS